MFLKINQLYFFILIGFIVDTTYADSIDCKNEVINLSSDEVAEIYNVNKYRERGGEQRLVVSNFRIENKAKFIDFKEELNNYVKSEKGAIDNNSSQFIKLQKNINNENFLEVLNIFGEDKYDKKTNFYFEKTIIRMRYKDLVNEIIMNRYGEVLWGKLYPFPSWNVPKSEEKSKLVAYPNKNKFTLPSFDPMSKFPRPIFKNDKEWQKYNGEHEYQFLLNGYYDRNTYYTWRDEWSQRNSRINGEWKRDYLWLEKVINEYDGSNKALVDKLNIAKKNLVGMCE